MKQPKEQEPDGDERELHPGERARLARMALNIIYGDAAHAMPEWVHDLGRRLDKKIATSSKEARSRHWEQNADLAQQAAGYYLKAQELGQPISLDAVAKQFNTSARSVSRYAEQLRRAAGASKKGEPVDGPTRRNKRGGGPRAAREWAPPAAAQTGPSNHPPSFRDGDDPEFHQIKGTKIYHFRFR